MPPERDASDRRWGFHTLYWFVAANYMELIAYILMRAFASSGDVYHLNRGLGLSPWIVLLPEHCCSWSGCLFSSRRSCPLCMVYLQGKTV